MHELRAALREGRDALTPALRERFREAPDLVLDILRDPAREGWETIHAVRLVGELGRPDAVGLVLHLLEDADADDYVTGQALSSIVSLGLRAIPEAARFLEGARPSLARDMAIEALDRIALEHPGAPELATGRLMLEGLLARAEVPAERGFLAAVIADFGDPASIEPLLRGLRRPDVTTRDFEAIRDAVERLGGECPDWYFTPQGRGYPLDEEKNPRCPACGVSLIIREFGELEHPQGTCEATLGAGGEPDLHR